MDEAAQTLRTVMRLLARKLGLLQKSEAACCGITMGQCHVLLEADSAAALTLSDLAQRLNVDKSTASRTVDGLVGAGLLQREVDDADRRCVRITVTAKGRELAERINRCLDAYYCQVVAAVAPMARPAVVQGLSALLAAVLDSDNFRSPAADCCGGAILDEGMPADE